MQLLFNLCFMLSFIDANDNNLTKTVPYHLQDYSIIVHGVPSRDDNKIVGGNPAPFLPFQVLLRFQHFIGCCGGSIIHPNWILTAAHCLEGVTEVWITAGEYYVHQYEGNEQLRSADAWFIHDQYDSLSFDYDFALLWFREPLELGENVQPIELAVTLPRPGVFLAASGWGAVFEDGAMSNMLLIVYLQMLDQSNCSSIHEGDITDRMICAGGVEGKDSCQVIKVDVTNTVLDAHMTSIDAVFQGDSGGPLFTFPDLTLVGITSWGIGCGRPNLPGIYSAVPEAIGWICSQTSLYCL